MPRQGLVALTVALVLACRAGITPGAPLDRPTANALIQAFARAEGGDSEGLGADGIGALGTPSGDLYFELEGATLKASALIYRFRKPPRPGVIDGFRAEQAAGTATGGGQVEFEEENGGLYLARSYAKAPDPETFRADMRALLAASGVWSREVLPRVSDRVFRPGDGGAP